MSDAINNRVLRVFLVLIGMICIAVAIYIKRPSHHYIDMVEGWKCTEGTANVHEIPPDNCKQWTKL